jgi:hypothetical protein
MPEFIFPGITGRILYIRRRNQYMKSLYRFIVFITAVLLLAGCGHKKKPSMSGEEKVEVADFIDFFQPLKLPAQLQDSVLLKKEKDSLLINYKIFTQFVPDSVLLPVFGKGVKPKIYPLGKAAVPDAETYLFIKTATADKKALYVLVFDKKKQYMTALTALRMDQSNITKQTLSVDRKLGITKSILRRNANGTMSEGKDVYVLDEPSKKFILVMTDALEDKPAELINPIDTLSRKQKYTADYSSGKNNLVSIRDGRKNDRLTFFVHFEKNNGECTGELKGEAMIKSSNTAEYSEDGDPCVLKFNFSFGSVTLKEESCGARRGLQCLFDGSFARKKDIKPLKSAKKK